MNEACVANFPKSRMQNLVVKLAVPGLCHLMRMVFGETSLIN